MAGDYILSIDQGTTSSRTIVFNHDSATVGEAQQEFTQHYPRPGWVEHDANEIWEVTLRVMRQALEDAGVSPGDIAAIGITNQRETVVMWDRETGEPVHNAIVWQDRRGAQICTELSEQGYDEMVANKTGLVIDAYFSGSKVKWLLDNVDGLKDRAQNGEIALGTLGEIVLGALVSAFSPRGGLGPFGALGALGEIATLGPSGGLDALRAFALRALGLARALGALVSALGPFGALDAFRIGAGLVGVAFVGVAFVGVAIVGGDITGLPALLVVLAGALVGRSLLVARRVFVCRRFFLGVGLSVVGLSVVGLARVLRVLRVAFVGPEVAFRGASFALVVALFFVERVDHIAGCRELDQGFLGRGLPLLERLRLAVRGALGLAGVRSGARVFVRGVPPVTGQVRLEVVGPDQILHVEEGCALEPHVNERGLHAG